MSEIEHEEVVNSDDDEDKDSAPVTKIRSYTDIMKMKLDKWVSLDLFMYLLNFNCNWQVDGQAGQASLHPRATEGQRRQQGPGVQPQHNGKVRDREENTSPGTHGMFHLQLCRSWLWRVPSVQADEKEGGQQTSGENLYAAHRHDRDRHNDWALNVNALPTYFNIQILL